MRRILASVVVMTATAGAGVEPDPEAVAKVVKAHAKGFRTCWQRELSKSPAVAKGGKIVLAVVLDKTGVVTSTKVTSTTMKHKPTEDCLVEVMTKLVFPVEAPRTFNFPFVFTQA